MKNKVLSYIIIIASISFFACEKSSDNEPTFTVSGFTTYNGGKIEAVEVSIDNKFNLTALSDENGYFIISGISRGEHSLKMTKAFDANGSSNEESKSYSAKTIEIDVNQNTEINNLKLPKAVSLFDPNLTSESSVNLEWSKTDDDDFREYKLYRHNSSGLDESTGTLIHVATKLSDTTFVDTGLSPLTEYFYRIYVLDNFGLIGGSNIINTTTSNAELIKNNGFEELENGEPVFWDLIGSISSSNEITVDSSISYEGENSIKINALDAQATTNLGYNISGNLLVPDTEYELSFYYISSLESNLDLVFSEEFRSPPVFNTGYEETPITTGWTRFSYTFKTPLNFNNGDVYIRFDFHNFDSVMINIDNVYLKQL
ncbi:carbohydrate binding domain-containing protein [Cellulophaga sp. Asnod2-G02]|uniref:carbohydrate binding domain-containing protein n=1 Tax=Cellulophaga sp. Asnod2-G02 TaxID=3160572 RepID=UPI00386D4583